jgi:hypothetical protein
MNAMSDKLAERLANTADRLARLKARQLLRDMQTKNRIEDAERRADVRRRIELGSAVLTAGCGDWTPTEIVGLLLDGRERAGSSPTMRIGARRRGEEHLSLTPKPRGQDPPNQETDLEPSS